MLCAKFFRHGNRLLHGEMGDVRAVSQAIEDEGVEPLKLALALRWNLVAIGAVGNVTDTEPQNLESRAVV